MAHYRYVWANTGAISVWKKPYTCKHMYNLFIDNYSHYCTTFNIVMIVSPCFEVKTFSPSIIYTYILIVVQINKVLFY